MKKITKGDWVEVLDDSLSGEVVSIEGNQVTLQTSDGFQLVFDEREVIRIPNGTGLEIDRVSLREALAKEQSAERKKGKTPRSKDRNLPMEVDLHIHQLTNSTKSKEPFDLLNLQIETAKRQLDFAISKRIQRIVFIHGVGEGVLRAELETLFNRYENLKFYDADYRKYGLGATEVYIFQNPG